MGEASFKDLPFEYRHRWADIGLDFADRDDPPLRNLVSHLEQRDRDLEDYLALLKTAAAGVTLNLRGQVTAVETDRYYPPPPLAPLTPEGFAASLSAYAGGVVTVEIRKNGVAVASLAPTVGLSYVELTETWDTTDYATIAVTAWAAGARGMVAGLV